MGVYTAEWYNVYIVCRCSQLEIYAVNTFLIYGMNAIISLFSQKFFLENTTPAVAYHNTFLLLMTPETKRDWPYGSNTVHSHISMAGTTISVLLCLQVTLEWSEGIRTSCLWLNCSSAWFIMYGCVKLLHSVNLQNYSVFISCSNSVTFLIRYCLNASWTDRVSRTTLSSQSNT
jgi:hypothetical protein